MVDKRKDIVTMGGNPVTIIGKEVKVGDKAPDFTVLTNDLQPFSLQDAGDSIKIISVVPSLDTGVCEFQTTHFNQEASELGDVKILTISVDLPFAQKRFCGAKGIDKVITLSIPLAPQNLFCANGKSTLIVSILTSPSSDAS